MKITARFDRPRMARRTAFTLIELLVVIAIIAALMALSASAVMKFMGVQQENNTKSTLERTQSNLGKAWSKVKDQANKEPIPAAIELLIRTNLAGNDANATIRVRVIYVKLKLRQAFPMNFNEALNTTIPPSPLPALPVYQQYLGQYGIGGSLGVNYESSACLLMALQRGVSGAGINPEELNKGGATGTGQNGIAYLTDAWGQPIYFSRVPAGNPYLNPSVGGATPNNYNTAAGPVVCYSQTGAHDPVDPQGCLQTPNWGTTFGAAFQNVTLQYLASGNTSYKLAPMLASSGTDKTPQFDPISFAPTVLGADDLFSTP